MSLRVISLLLECMTVMHLEGHNFLITFFEFTFDELANHPEYLAFIIDPTNSCLEKEKIVSIKAGELIGKLYDKLREGYKNPDSEESM